MGDTQNTANTTNHHTMKRAIVIAASLALVWGAPQFKTDTIRSNCRSEVTTAFEETETETVNKVICQTEFREAKCEQIENFVCVDSITNKCGIEKVLKNVSYTETVCRSKLENICEKEFIDGEAKPVEGSCVSKPTEVCEEMTRFQEEFVDEDRCRDIPIKDCKNVQSEVCSEQQELVCEPQHTEDCQIVPHEECQHIVEKIPKKVSKKITKVVCDESEEEKKEPTEKPTEIAEDDSSNTDDNTNNIINNIFEIFGIRNTGENEIEDENPELVPVITTTEFMIDDGLLSESTTKTTTTSTTGPTTTTTKSTTSTTTTTTLRTSTVEDVENIPTEPATTVVRRMDGSKIVFSDKELEARNKDLANRVYLNVVPTRPTSTESAPRTSEDPHSRIFFPE